MKINKIFLGGTCPNNNKDFDYRKILIPVLEKNKIDYFNPVVSNWNEDCLDRENKEKEICDTHLYLICPNMKGVYSIAEAFSTLMKYPEKQVIFGFVRKIPHKSFTENQMKSNSATLQLFEDCALLTDIEYETIIINNNFESSIVAFMESILYD